MKFVDLSITVNENTPLYPGDKSPKITPEGSYDKTGFLDHYVSFNNHIGTHIDAPVHIFADGKSLDQIPLEQFTGRGVCVNVENKTFSLEILKQADIREGDIVLLHTGMSERLFEADYYKSYPQIPVEVAQYLVDKKVKMVGVDMGGVDHDFSIHKLLLKNEVLIIENMTNLGGLEGKKFKVYAFPIKFQLDASPVRVAVEIL